MLIILRKGSIERGVERLRDLLGQSGLEAAPVEFGDRLALRLESVPGSEVVAGIESLPEVERIVPVSHPMQHAVRRDGRGVRTVRAGDATLGGGGFTVIAGPCAVEDEALLMETAAAVKEGGADMLRGGAYKPRSSPYSFQGLGVTAFEMLARAGEATGLPVVTEIMDRESIEAALDCVDVLQVGSRNMHNTALLKRVGRSGRPVFLKRGMSATLEDLLLSAEYLMNEGNPDVVLCERGIRTFSQHSRFTLDLSVVPAIHEVSDLPVFVDPSHATGLRNRVAPMSRAAVASGADGVMIEVHPDPSRALSDGAQALRPEEFARLTHDLRALAEGVLRTREAVR